MADDLDHMRNELQQMRAQVSTLQHEFDRLEERRDNDRALLIEVKEAVINLGDQFKASLHAVHKRVDVMQEARAKEQGKAEGRAEAKALMFKWVGAVVALIAIVGWLNSPRAGEQHVLPARDQQEERMR